MPALRSLCRLPGLHPPGTWPEVSPGLVERRPSLLSFRAGAGAHTASQSLRYAASSSAVPSTDPADTEAPQTRIPAQGLSAALRPPNKRELENQKNNTVRRVEPETLQAQGHEECPPHLTDRYSEERQKVETWQPPGGRQTTCSVLPTNGLKYVLTRISAPSIPCEGQGRDPEQGLPPALGSAKGWLAKEQGQKQQNIP